MNPASEEQLIRYARVLVNLGKQHGLSNFRRAGDGRLIVDIAHGRTYLDIARFELAAEGLLQAGVSVILTGTETATRADRGPLTTNQAA